MKLFNPLLAVIPPELFNQLLVFFVMGSGFCAILGMRRAAGSLFIMAISLPLIMAIAETLMTDVFTMLPERLIQPIMWLILIIVCLSLFGMSMSLLFGKPAWEQAKGNLLSSAIISILRLVFSRPVILLLVVGSLILLGLSGL